MDAVTTRKILDELAPLKARARAENLMIQKVGMHRECRFTADQLDAHNEHGSFIWSAVNWVLEPKGERDFYPETIEVHLPAGARQVLIVIADRHGESVSEYIRRMIKAEVGTLCGHGAW